MKEYKILKDLIKFNTIKDKDNKQILDYIEVYLKNIGFKTDYKGKNLIMSIGKNAKIGFLGHTDTVEYIEGWNTNPFELTKIEDKLYGLGTCDMKGGIAAVLETVSKVDFSKLSYGMKLYFTYDEEIGFGGIYDITKSDELFPEVMIFGEPTNNEMLAGSKGLLEFEFDFKGIKAHSSNPEKGKSANMNAVKFLYELEEFYNDKIKKYKQKNYETTMNIGTINGGSAKNSVSANCKVNIDFRIANKEHIQEIKEKIQKLATKYECDVNIIEEVEPFINKCEYVSKIKTANFMTEASFIKNATRIILGPGPITAHEVNEYITEESYKKIVEQYKQLIIKVCK